MERREIRIETPRLLVRSVRMEDWSFIRDIWEDFARSPYRKYDGPTDTEDYAVRRRVAAWCNADMTRHIFLSVCLEGRPVGYISAHAREVGCEIGYCFHSSVHGRGIASESIDALLERLAQAGCPQVTAGTALANIPSVRLLERLGFTLEGTEPVSFYKDERGTDIFFEGGNFCKVLIRGEAERC